MARYKYDLQYEIRLNSNAWIDISALADSRKLSIQRNSCTTEFKSAIDSASFTLQPKPALYDLRAEVVNILMEATDNANHAYVRISKRNTMPDEDPVIFLGVVDASSISITTLRIPQAITIQCQDISIVNLDNAPSQYIVLENKKTSEIVKTLIEHAGFIVGSVDIKAEDDVYHRAFVAYSDKDDTYRDYIDTLLFEAGGYALDCGKNGLMNIIRIRIGENTEGARLVDNYLDAEGINSSTSILDSDGIKLKWSTIAETHPDSPQTVYVDDINREIDDETGILKGDEIAPGGYWPEDGNVDKTYFEYEAEFLDREYQSGQKKNVNEDLSLILVKNTSASINVWTEDGVQLNPEDVFDYPIPAEFEEETNPAYYPDKAWWLLHNKSGQNLNLTSFSIQGDCIYRDRINTLLMPSTSAKPEEYESVYIYTAEQAQKFARFYHDIKKYARTQHAWSELGIVEVGSLVKIAHKTTDIGQVAYVVQVTYSYIGDRIKSDCIAISIGPYNEYNFRQWGQNNGANDSSAAISSITDYYLASSEYQGVTVNTPGWSADADYGADDSKPYLWKYTKTQYVNGKVENSKPVIIAVKGDAKTIKNIATEYALANSSVTPPAEDSDAWQDTLPAKTDQSQSIWKRTVITYSDGTIEYTDVIVLSGLIVFQYAYGRSAVNPPTPSIWIWGKRFMVWGNQFIASKDSSVWMTERPQKPEGQWYLWMRISTDGGQTWNDPVCISGNDAVGYELSYSPATYQMTDRGIVKTRGQYIDFFLDISNIPYNANDIVWNVEANGETPLVKGTDWDILDNDPTQIRVTFPFNFKSKSVTVSVYIIGYEDFEKSKTVAATIIDNEEAAYLHVVSELPEDSDNATSRGPLKEGDYVLLETTNSEENVERVPYTWKVIEGIGRWVLVDGSAYNYAEVMSGVLADAVTNSVTSISAIYGFFENIIGKTGFLEMLFAQYIKILGAIYGGDYDKYGKSNGGRRGFHLSKDGIFQALSAILYQVKIKSIDFEGKTVLETKQAIEAGEYSFAESTPICFKSSNYSASEVIRINNIPCNRLEPTKFEFGETIYYGTEVKKIENPNPENIWDQDDENPFSLTYTVQHDHSFIFRYDIHGNWKSNSWSIKINDVIIDSGSGVQVESADSSGYANVAVFSANQGDIVNIWVSTGDAISLVCITSGYNAFAETIQAGKAPYVLFLSDSTQLNRDIIAYASSDYCIKGNADVKVNGQDIPVIYTKESTGILSDIKENFLLGEEYYFASGSVATINGNSTNVLSLIVMSDYAEFSNNERVVLTIDDNHIAYGLSLSILSEISRVVTHRIVIDDEEGSIGTGNDPIPNLFAIYSNLQSIITKQGTGLTEIEYEIPAGPDQIAVLYNTYGTRFQDYVRVTIKNNPSDVCWAKIWFQPASYTSPSDKYMLGLYDENFNLIDGSTLGLGLTTQSTNKPSYYNATFASLYDTHYNQWGGAGYYVTNGFVLVEEKVNSKLIVIAPDSPSQEEIESMESGQVYIDANGVLKIKR